MLHSQDDNRSVAIKNAIRTIPHWPHQGIMFRDITTLLQNPTAFQYCIDILAERYKDMKIDVVAGFESRGFILGAPLALALKASLALIRKPGKLPYKTIKASYQKEYGVDTVEMHEDAVSKGQRVLLVDDLIATGGTLAAGIELVEKLGGDIVECTCVVELPELKGRSKVKHPIFCIIEFEGE